MKNITLAIDDELLDRVRRRAAQRGTTVNSVVREQLTLYVSRDDERDQARRALLELAENSTWDPGPDWKWRREDAYADRLFPRHEHPVVRGDRS